MRPRLDGEGLMAGRGAPKTAATLDPRVVFLSFLACVLLAEALLAWRGPAWAARHLGLPLHSRGLLEDRLRASQGPSLLLLGDSVLYGTALREHAVQDWPQRTPAAYLAQRLPQLQVVNLSDEGLYPLDLLALAGAAKVLRPQAIVVELNYRMLCPEAGDPVKALTRPYLQGWLPEAFRGVPQGLGMETLSAFLEEHWRLLRYAGAISEQALPGGTKRWMSAWVGQFFPPEEGIDPDVLLNLKIRPYYQAPVAGPQHQGLLALAALAETLSKQGVPVLVFLTPQNFERVDEYLDKVAFKENLALLVRCFDKPNIRYRDWSRPRPGDVFFDHCHLDPAGNQVLAQRIAQELKL